MEWQGTLRRTGMQRCYHRGVDILLNKVNFHRLLSTSTPSRSITHQGLISDLSQALNNYIDGPHIACLAHLVLFFSFPFSLPKASWSVATLATHLFPSPKCNLTPLLKGTREEQPTPFPRLTLPLSYGVLRIKTHLFPSPKCNLSYGVFEKNNNCWTLWLLW